MARALGGEPMGGMALHARLRINVLEADYRKLFTKRSAVEYLYANLKK